MADSIQQGLLCGSLAGTDKELGASVLQPATPLAQQKEAAWLQQVHKTSRFMEPNVTMVWLVRANMQALTCYVCNQTCTLPIAPPARHSDSSCRLCFTGSLGYLNTEDSPTSASHYSREVRGRVVLPLVTYLGV